MCEKKTLRVAVRPMRPGRECRTGRNARMEVCNVFVRIAGNAITGFGEASPTASADEPAGGAAAKLREAGGLIAQMKIESVDDIGTAWSEIGDRLSPCRAAQCALDLALWDWLAKRHETTVAELAHGSGPRPVRTFRTIEFSDPAALEKSVEEFQGCPLIKYKSGRKPELAPLRFIAERTCATLAVDANGSWSDADIGAVSRELAALGVVFIRQPLPFGDDGRMRACASQSELPILAGEGCRAMADLDRLRGRFAGFEINLSKCGGLTPALAMLRRARELGFLTVVAGTTQSSLLTAAGAVLGQRSRYADLDGVALLADDPFLVVGEAEGLRLHHGMLIPSVAPGFGLEPRPGLFA